MEQVGFILDTKDKKAKVEVRRISGCGGGCKTCSGCDTPSMIIDLDNNIGAKRGDFVEIRGQSKTILKYTFLTYMIPAAFFIFGIVFGINNFQKKGYENFELYGFLVGIIFLIISFVILSFIDKKSKDKTKEMLQMVKIID